MKIATLLGMLVLLSGCGMQRIWTRSEPPDAGVPADCYVACAKVDAEGVAVIDWAPWTDGSADQLRAVCKFNKDYAAKTVGQCEQRRLACAAGLLRLKAAGAIK